MSDGKIRVLLVDDIAETRENLKKLIFFEDDIEVVGTAGTGEEGIRIAKQLRPDVVIMDINMPGIDGITAAEILNRELPGVGIIMMSVQGEADYLRRSMLAGAREFLIKPPSVEQIITSIRRVHSLSKVERIPVRDVEENLPPSANGHGQSRANLTLLGRTPKRNPQPEPAPPPMREEGDIIAVFGSKGGVGASSVAINLAIALHEQKPNLRIAVVDGNTEFGDLSVLLNVKATRTILDLVQAHDLENQEQFIEQVFMPHTSGIKVLPGPHPSQSDAVTGEQMKRIIAALRMTFDYVIFDTRPTFQEPILTILDNAQTILLVTTTDIPAIRNARLFFEITDELGYENDRVRLVINKFDPNSGVPTQAIQASIKHPIIAELPRDDRLAGNAIQQGLPFVLSNSRHPLSQGVMNLARKFSGVAGAPLPASEPLDTRNGAGNRKAPSPAPRPESAPATPAKQERKGLFAWLFRR